MVKITKVVKVKENINGPLRVNFNDFWSFIIMAIFTIGLMIIINTIVQMFK